jgi:CBS domain-containing protein
MDVFSIATQKPKYVSHEDKLIEAIEIMAKNRFRRIPVVYKEPTHESEQLIGIITASDILRLIDENGISVVDKNVGEVMIEEPLYIFHDDELGEATKLMTSNGIGGLPIVTDNYPTLCGIITERDIVKAFVNSIADATLNEFMTPVITLDISKGKLSDAIKQMHKSKSSRVVLIDKNQKIKGIITSSDILALIVSVYFSEEEEFNPDILKTPLKDLAKKDVITVKDDQSVAEVAKFLLEKKLGGVPVVNESGELVGMFSERELLNMIGTFGLF